MCSNYTQRCEQLIHNPIHTYYSIALLNMSIFSFNLLHLVSLIIIFYPIHRFCSTYTHFVDNFILVYTHLPHIIPHPTAPPMQTLSPIQASQKFIRISSFTLEIFLKRGCHKAASLYLFFSTHCKKQIPSSINFLLEFLYFFCILCHMAEATLCFKPI